MPTPLPPFPPMVPVPGEYVRLPVSRTPSRWRSFVWWANTLSMMCAVGMVLGLVVILLSGRLAHAVDRTSSLFEPLVPAVRAASTDSDPAVAHIWASFQEPSGEGFTYSCSGFFVAPDVVLTAAHCLVQGELDASTVLVEPGVVRLDGAPALPHGTCEASDWEFPDEFHLDGVATSQTESRWDYAVLRVPGCFSKKLGMNPLVVDGLLFEAGLPEGVAGPLPHHSASYPGDEPPGTLSLSTGERFSCWACDPHGLGRTNLNISQGSSGGVVWVESDGRRYAVGILVSVGDGGTFFRELDAEVLGLVADFAG